MKCSAAQTDQRRSLQAAQGSTIALVDASGNLVTQYSYDPFGNTTMLGAASGNPLQCTGRENEGNGLYFYRARYYLPALGRFVNEDPLRFSGSGPNFYSYVFDNPTNLVDPSGLKGGNPVTNWFGGVGRNASFAWNWFWETGSFPDATTIRFRGHDWAYYGPDTPETQDMMNSPGIAWVNLVYLSHGCQSNGKDINFGTIPAYLTTVQDPSSAAFQVGAFSTGITENADGTITYTMYNKADWHSLSGGISPDSWEHETDAMPMHEINGVGGSVRQMFQWTGAKPAGCGFFNLKGRK
jgi:RHS repeat-associated protein